MPEIWPPDLPFFNRADSHSRTGPLGVKVRTAMDAGPAKQRRRSTSGPKGYSGEIPWLDRYQFRRFEEFVSLTLEEGALAFEVTDPMDCLLKTFRFPDDPAYRAVAIGGSGIVRVSATLEMLSMPPRATISLAARIEGAPSTASIGDVLTGVRAVYAGEPGTLADRWINLDTGQVIGTSLVHTVTTDDSDEAIAYRTVAINGPSSTSAQVDVNGWLFSGTRILSIRFGDVPPTLPW